MYICIHTTVNVDAINLYTLKLSVYTHVYLCICMCVGIFRTFALVYDKSLAINVQHVSALKRIPIQVQAQARIYIHTHTLTSLLSQPLGNRTLS